MTQKQRWRTIGSRYEPEVAEAVEEDAARLGMTTSEWMRMAVKRQLARPVTQAQADPYRRPPTIEEQREQRRRERLATGQAPTGRPRKASEAEAS